MWLKRIGLSGLAAAFAAAGPFAMTQPANAVPDSRPLVWTFTKCGGEFGPWQGSAIGPNGEDEVLLTELTGGQGTGQVLQLEIDWVVGDAYTAKLSGTLNKRTGAVVMNGQVVAGDFLGSRVHEEGQLISSDNGKLCFAGTIRVMPGSGR